MALLLCGAGAAPASGGSGKSRPESAATAAGNLTTGKAAPDHAAQARLLEELGKTAAAAREYEAAFESTRAPEMLYRLALCRRTLGDYTAAREALRGYLREAPDGPLRDEVERQLAQLAVLIEARGMERPGSHAADREAPARPRQERPRAAPRSAAAPAKEPPAASPPTSPDAIAASSSPAVAATGPGLVSESHEPSAPPRPLVSIAHDPEATAPALVSDAHEASVPAPALPAPLEPPPSRGIFHPAWPWLAGGAVALGAAGSILCVGAHQISSSLDDRFGAGALTTADLPRYSKARAEGIAGTALIGAAVIAAGAAVVLAW